MRIGAPYRSWVWITASAIAIAVLLTAIFASIRRTRIFVEECDVTVLDNSGRGIPNLRISEDWNAYSYDLSGGGDVRTDPNGRVAFPRQTVTRSLLFWRLQPVLVRMNYGVHASRGVTANVRVSEPSLAPAEAVGDSYACEDQACTNHPIRLTWKTGTIRRQ